MRYASLLCLLMLVGCIDPAATPQQALFLEGNIIDLTHPFDEETLYWPTSEPFDLDTSFVGYTDAGYYYEAYAFATAEHGGTHIDAPIHFAEGGQRVDEIPLDRLLGRAILVDVSEQALGDRDYQVTVSDFEAWEDRHGPIPDGSIVLLRTGYGQFWPDADQYMGTSARGEEAVPELHFPGLHPEAARWIAEERTIHAIGIDTPSIDYGQSTLFEAHQALFEANIPAFENVANLDELPVTDFYVIALPMKIGGGSGGPLRIVAVLP